ncbi:MAG: hypothetical protein MUC41_07860 [Syntrophobacteraceae bacterium]|nr:hypothetical protein [Syntrophobacteraceae bacterium]
MILLHKHLDALEDHWAVVAIQPEERERARNIAKARLIQDAFEEQLQLAFIEKPTDDDLLERLATAYEIAAAEGLDLHFEKAVKARAAGGDVELEMLLRWLHVTGRMMVASSLWYATSGINSRYCYLFERVHDARPIPGSRPGYLLISGTDRLFRHSSSVLPWPFAPGISGQYAMNQSPSLSTIAVNSFLMEVLPLSACELMPFLSLSILLNPFLGILPGRVSSAPRSVESRQPYLLSSMVGTSALRFGLNSSPAFLILCQGPLKSLLCFPFSPGKTRIDFTSRVRRTSCNTWCVPGKTDDCPSGSRSQQAH